MIWVLESAYGFAKAEVLAVVDQVMRTAQFKIAAKDVCWKALGDFSRGNGDFADYYIGRSNENEGSETTLAFDRALKDPDRFVVF